FMVICALSLGVVLNNNLDIIGRYMKQIDMFHLGEMLGPASGFLLGKKPYSEIFFYRGMGADVLIGMLSIKIFGYSIGGFLTTTLFLNFISSFLFFLLISILFRNNWFYLVSIWFFMSKRVTIDIFKDIGTWIAIYIIFRLCNDKKPKTIFSYLLGCIAFSLFFFYIDRGFYLTSISLIIGFMLFLFHKNIKYLISIIAGLLTSCFIFFIILGKDAFFAFTQTTFIDIPRMKSLSDEYVFPRFQTDSLMLHWLPIILIIIHSFMIIFLYNVKKYKKDRMLLFILFIHIYSILYFRVALGRSDFPHIVGGSTLIFLTAFLLIQYLWNIHWNDIKLKNYSWWRNIIFTVGFCLVLFVPQVNLGYKNTLKLFFNAKKTVTDLVSVSKIKDNDWLTDEQLKVVKYIRSHTTDTDFVYVFPSEPLYYYFFNRMNPTRFYATWFSQPSFYRQESLLNLKKNKPKYILYKDASIWNKPDFVDVAVRFSEINDWILKNYKEDTIIGSTVIMISSFR
ncbi:MAG: hypothetical protein Q7R95_11730, partial [bacterium]|nr:hypothetical protein [bacterium]